MIVAALLILVAVIVVVLFLTAKLNGPVTAVLLLIDLILFLLAFGVNSGVR